MDFKKEVLEWLGDGVRCDKENQPALVWTKPDHHLILSRSYDLKPHNPNLKDYFVFAVNAINAKIVNKRIKPSDIPFQEFNYCSQKQVIYSGEHGVFRIRSFSEFSVYFGSKNATYMVNYLGEFIQDALNEAQFNNSIRK